MVIQEKDVIKIIRSEAEMQFMDKNYDEICPKEDRERFCLLLARIDYLGLVEDMIVDIAKTLTFVYCDIISPNRTPFMVLSYIDELLRNTIITTYEDVVNEIYYDEIKLNCAEHGLFQENSNDYLQRGN